MKLARIEVGGEVRLALVDEGRGTVHLLSRAMPDDLVVLIRDFNRLRGAVARDDAVLPLDGVVFLPPIGRPPHNVFCVGKNYVEHAREFQRSGFDATSGGTELPDVPIVFTKASNTLIGHGAEIRWDPTVATQVDYEAELAVVIGRRASRVSIEEAQDVIFGYTLANDVTARDRQKRFKQWFLGKSLDTFCPMGPWIATPDEVDLDRLVLRCWVNDDLRQEASLADLIFDIPTIIATISEVVTLDPGDVIATGTPPGVGIGFRPPRFLAGGDVVRIAADGLGQLVNRCNTSAQN